MSTQTLSTSPEEAHFMLSMIPADFDVVLLKGDQESGLFFAKRKLVWHFVRWDNNDENNSISQWHVPRCVVAAAANALRRLNADRLPALGDRSFMLLMWEDLKLGIRADGSHVLKHRQIESNLPAPFIDALAEDVDAWTRAQGKVRYRDEAYVLSRSKTHGGFPVADESRGLIDAVAFEREIIGRLDAEKRFGIYSAYCTLRDYCLDDEITEAQLEKLISLREAVEWQLKYDPEEIPEEYRDIFAEVQRNLLSEPIWGLGIAMPPDDAVRIMTTGMLKLDRVQRAQFVLMNGMHNAGLFMPLAVILDIIDYERYCGIQAKEYQPDSDEEQRLRADTAYIQLLGRGTVADPEDPTPIQRAWHDWLAENDWQNLLAPDQADSATTTEFVVASEGIRAECFVDIDEPEGCFTLSAYLAERVPDAAAPAVRHLINEKYSGMVMGAFELLSRGRLRFSIGIEGVANHIFAATFIDDAMRIVLRQIKSAFPELLSLLHSEKTPMRLTDTLNEWLKQEEWNEDPEIDDELQTSSTSFNFTVGDFSLKCWFDISEKAEVLKFFAYFNDSKVPEKKLDEVQKFVTAVSNGMLLGNLQLLREDRTLRYYHAIDVENAAFEPAHITNMLNAGVRAMEFRLPQYMAICFGGKTAEEVLTEDV